MCALFSEYLFGFPPYSYYELIDWIAKLSEGMKVAIVSSLVTVIGFFIAYASATANWKSQLLANIKLQASGEINSFFTEVGSLVTDCEIYASDVIKSIEEIKSSSNEEEQLFHVSYLTERGQEIDLKRKRLVALSIQVHQFTGKYANLFISVPKVQSNFDTAAKALNDVATKTWFTIPFLYKESVNPINSYLEQINKDKLQYFIDTAQKNRVLLSFYPGSAGGVLQSDVVPFNGFSLLNMIRRSKILHDVFEDLRKAKKNG